MHISKNQDQKTKRYITQLIVFGVFLSVIADCIPVLHYSIDLDQRILISSSTIWIGLIIRMWAVVTLGTLFRTVIHIESDHRIIQTGPYRMIRHPSYLGSLICIAGICLIFESLAVLIIMTGVSLLGFMNRITIEEAELSKHLGTEYIQYQEKTWRLIPFVY